MTPLQLSTAPHLIPSADMLPVFKLFLLPVGGGIPAGVLLARDHGLPWALTAVLYLVSDLVLALSFEPLLRLLTALGARIPFLARFSVRLRAVTARSVAPISGTCTGPLGLVLIAFGVDPMTGRATALAAGHGFLAGWGFAIAGDMLYFAVIAVTTLQLNAYVHDPEMVMLLVLAAMFLLPMLVRYLRGGARRAAAPL